jgi:hypothetical protein
MRFFVLLFFVALYPIFTLASDFPVPSGDITALLLELATNYKTLGTMGVLSIVTVLTVQAVKAWVEDEWKYKRLTVLVVSIAYSILAGLMIEGSSVATVVISVFITSGGAVALYESLKGSGIIKKKE